MGDRASCSVLGTLLSGESLMGDALRVRMSLASESSEICPAGVSRGEDSCKPGNSWSYFSI